MSTKDISATRLVVTIFIATLLAGLLGMLISVASAHVPLSEAAQRFGYNMPIRSAEVVTLDDGQPGLCVTAVVDRFYYDADIPAWVMIEARIPDHLRDTWVLRQYDVSFSERLRTVHAMQPMPLWPPRWRYSDVFFPSAQFADDVRRPDRLRVSVTLHQVKPLSSAELARQRAFFKAGGLRIRDLRRLPGKLPDREV
jgi:hypothetical protein